MSVKRAAKQIAAGLAMWAATLAVAPDAAAQQACSLGTECGSTFCVDGYCCDTACSGACMGCSAAVKGQGADGTCGPVVSGEDPDDDCAVEDPSTCGSVGFCDGAGQCALYAAGTVCLTSGCNPSTFAFEPADLCDGMGTCVDTGDAVSCLQNEGNPCSIDLCGDSGCEVVKSQDGMACPNGACVDGQCVTGGSSSASSGAGSGGGTSGAGGAGSGAGNASSGSSGSGANGSSSSGTGAGTPADDPGDDGGCSCRSDATSGQSGGAGWLWATLLTLGMAVRRRQR